MEWFPKWPKDLGTSLFHAPGRVDYLCRFFVSLRHSALGYYSPAEFEARTAVA